MATNINIENPGLKAERLRLALAQAAGLSPFPSNVTKTFTNNASNNPIEITATDLNGVEWTETIAYNGDGLDTVHIVTNGTTSWVKTNTWDDYNKTSETAWVQQ